MHYDRFNDYTEDEFDDDNIQHKTKKYPPMFRIKSDEYLYFLRLKENEIKNDSSQKDFLWKVLRGLFAFITIITIFSTLMSIGSMTGYYVSRNIIFKDYNPVNGCSSNINSCTDPYICSDSTTTRCVIMFSALTLIIIIAINIFFIIIIGLILFALYLTRRKTIKPKYARLN